MKKIHSKKAFTLVELLIAILIIAASWSIALTLTPKGQTAKREAQKLQAQIEENHKLVTMNIRYLKEIGVMNYQKIFIKFYDLFLMDPSNFEDIFAKYDTADLINKLNKNVNIVEYL